jgi:hypothetical protein
MTNPPGTPAARYFLLAFTLLMTAATLHGGKDIETRLEEPGRIIRPGDLMRTTLKLPGRKFGSLEKVERNGEVATPDGSFIKADGLTLAEFRKNLLNLYEKTYEPGTVEVEAFIYSSPYHIITVPKITKPTAKGDETEEEVPQKQKKPVPAVLPRSFKTPLTLWQAIKIEGGIPKGVDPKRIKVLRRDLKREVFDGSTGADSELGRNFLNSGDYIFLVPPDVPVSQVFDPS